MTNDHSNLECVFDTYALLELAHTKSDNLRTVLLGKLKDGCIGVPIVAWNEFRELYEDEAKKLSPYITIKLKHEKIVAIFAARIATELNSGFRATPYDSNVSIYCAAQAQRLNIPVVTGKGELDTYSHMECTCHDIYDWATQLDKQKIA